MYMREQVVRLWQQGKKPAQIVRELVEEDIVTTRHTVTHWIFCWTKCTGLADQKVGATFSDNKEHRRVHGQAYGMNVDINGKKAAKPYSEKSHMIY